MFLFYLDNFLDKIENQTLIIFGEKDRETPLYMAKSLNAGIKNSSLKIIKNAGHFCFIDKHNREGRYSALSPAIAGALPKGEPRACGAVICIENRRVRNSATHLLHTNEQRRSRVLLSSGAVERGAATRRRGDYFSRMVLISNARKLRSTAPSATGSSSCTFSSISHE